MLRVLWHGHRRRGHEGRTRDRVRDRSRHHGRKAPDAQIGSEGRRRRRRHRPARFPCGRVHSTGERHRCRGGEGIPVCTDPARGGRIRHGRLRCGDGVHGPVRRSGDGSEHHMLIVRGRNGHRTGLHPPRTMGRRDGGAFRETPERPPARMGRGVRTAVHRRQRQIGQTVRCRGGVLHNRHGERFRKARTHRQRIQDRDTLW